MLRMGLCMLNTNFLETNLVHIIVKHIMACLICGFLEVVTQGLSKSLHYAATNGFPDTTVGNVCPCVVEPHKVVGMMRNVVIQGDACNVK